MYNIVFNLIYRTFLDITHPSFQMPGYLASGNALNNIFFLFFSIQSKAKELPLSAVRFMEELGECAFGKIYKGHLYLPGMDHAPLVAIKTLKDYNNPQQWTEFQQEASLMAEKGGGPIP